MRGRVESYTTVEKLRRMGEENRRGILQPGTITFYNLDHVAIHELVDLYEPVHVSENPDEFFGVRRQKC